MSNLESEYDVIVIGAGVAGLAAARRLGEAGRSVLLLEAHDYPGGRIMTIERGVELGAEFIHGSPSSTLTLLGEAGLDAVETTGDAWVSTRGVLEPARWSSDALSKITQLAAKVDDDESVDAFLDRVVRDEPRLRDAAQTIRRRVCGFDAADPARASITAIAAEWQGEASIDAEASRVVRGYGMLAEHMANAASAAHVELRYESVVRAVQWTRGRVVVKVERDGRVEQVRARAAVVTVSIGVLCASPRSVGAIRFDPPLTQKRAALDGLALGPVLKVMLGFREAFWERIDDGRYRDASFFFAGHDATFRTVWTLLPARTRWLSAWLGGPAAAELSAFPDRLIRTAAADDVQKLFGDRLRVTSVLLESHVHNWQADPYIRGAYSYVTVGGLASRRALAAPIDDTLFFAGEATDDTADATTVAGAIASGERAAREWLHVDRG